MEVHPTSSRKALGVPTEDWEKISAIFKSTGLEGEIKRHTPTPHEIDAITAASTAYLFTQNQAGTIGDVEEGTVIAPGRQTGEFSKI